MTGVSTTTAFHPKAKRDVSDALHYYQEQGNNLLAASFIAEVARVIALLAQNPQLGSPLEGNLLSFPLKRFPYSLIYRLSPSRSTSAKLRILALWHHKRLPNGWQNRV